MQHVISFKRLADFGAKHPDAAVSLQHWYKAVKGASWRNFGDVRSMFGSADVAGQCVVFNLGGNKFRLIAAVHYPRAAKKGGWTLGRVYVRSILTHREYEKGAWKRDCGC